MQIVNTEDLSISTVDQLRLDNPIVSIPKAPTAAQLAQFGHAPLEVSDPPDGDIITRLPKAEKRADGKYYPTFLVESFNMDDKRQLIKARRDQAIYAGVTIDGLAIDTDEVTQGRLAGAALQALIEDAYTVRWKVAGQFITLDASQILGIAQAVRTHVQACFDREAELLSLTDPETGKPREPSAEEINSGWPA